MVNGLQLLFGLLGAGIVLKAFESREHKEVKNFNKLITDPRQFSFFKSMYFYYKGTKKNIPQETIDQIR